MLLALLLACGGDPPRPADLPESTFDALPGSGSWIRLRAQAHYAATVTERRPASLVSDASTHFLFPVFPEHKTEERGVKLVVRTGREPERLVSYETFTVEGVLRPLREEDLSAVVQSRMLEQSGHWVADGALLLDARRIESVDGVWEAP